MQLEMGKGRAAARRPRAPSRDRAELLWPTVPGCRADGREHAAGRVGVGVGGAWGVAPRETRARDSATATRELVVVGSMAHGGRGRRQVGLGLENKWAGRES